MRGKLVTRGKAKRADYILYYKPNIPIALIEAKDNNHSVGDGMQQALDYAVTLDIPFVFSSNGDGFVFHDRTGDERRDGNEPRPGRFSLARRPLGALPRLEGAGAGAEKIVLQDYYDDGSGKAPRYYQRNAVNAAIEAIAKGPEPHPAGHGHRHGQDLHRLSDHLAAVEGRAKKRILFLADRNVLVDQTMVNDFRPFGPAMAKLSTSAKTIERADGTESTDHRPRQEAPHRHGL